MEKIGSLEASLPPEQPPTTQAITSLNNELTQEFKMAANAVTKLYRVANEKNSLLKHQGYVDCLDSMLTMLDNDHFSSLDDVRSWCIRERKERLGTETNKKNTNNKAHPTYDFEFDKKKNHNSPSFHLSMAPLSVERSKARPNDKKARAIIQKHVLKQENGDHCSEPKETAVPNVNTLGDIYTGSHEFTPDSCENNFKKQKIEPDSPKLDEINYSGNS